jgi:hypothetical protein
MLTEVASFLAVLAAYSLLNGYWDDDDEWTKQFILYELRRTQTELGVLIPSKNMFHEA